MYSIYTDIRVVISRQGLPDKELVLQEEQIY